MARSSWIVVAGLWLVTGCFPAGTFGRIGYFDMAPRLSYQGFSFDRPPNPRWYMQTDEQHFTEVILRRDFWSPSETHTFFAQVSHGALDGAPASHEEFAEMARAGEEIAPYEVKLRSYEQTRTTRQNQWCIRFDSEWGILGTPVARDRELTMWKRGYRCLHPAFPRRTLDFYYSERGLPEEIDPDLWKEGETFLDGVRIDVAPNQPAS